MVSKGVMMIQRNAAARWGVRWWPLALTALLLQAGGASLAGEGRHGAHEHGAHHQSSDTAYKRAIKSYEIPDLTLTDMYGHSVKLAELMAADRSILMNFIFTSCSTICPVMSASFSQLQDRLQSQRKEATLISISIDPEHDTPERLRDYARRHGARAGWIFITGDPKKIVALQRALDAYRGSKMNHTPVTFLRNPGDSAWVRLEGVAGVSDLMKELQTSF